jgi:hypothetical protein
MPLPIGPIVAGVAARAAAKKAATKVAKKAVSKGSQASKVKQATPSKIRTSEGTFKVNKTKTGKTVLTDSKGNKYTLKKGDTVQKLAAREAKRRDEEYEVARAGFGYKEDIRPQFRSELAKSSKLKSKKKK